MDEQFEAALERFGELQKRRVLKMYNRHRAMFAECYVAQLLPGAEVVENPTAAWDIVWPNDDAPVRVQVKCSGQFLPMHGMSDKEPNWKLKEPKYGWEPDTNEKLLGGHHCDAFVLARHSGEDIRHGWEFAVLRPAEVSGWTTVTMTRLKRLGRPLVSTEYLEREMRRVLAQGERTSSEDAELEAGLQRGSADAWQRIAAIEPALVGGQLVGRWHQPEPSTETLLDGREVRSFEMGWVDYDERVTQLADDLYAVNAVAQFDWSEWDGCTRYPGGLGLAEAHVSESVRLTTRILRGDRFSEGMLNEALGDGSLAAAVSRMLVWRRSLGGSSVPGTV